MPVELARVEEIFAEALNKGDPALRAGYLDEACGADRDLRGRVESLLAAHVASGNVLQLPEAATAPFAPLSERPGSRIGRFKLLEQIGEGGFGVVFMAEQEEPVRRMVALKIIKLGMDTRQIVARFEAERQALAMMDHPNVAKVLDGGVTETGRPYFVMEIVKGVPVTDYCDALHLSVRQRLELMTQVCHAVQHAHQKGIIHRDLKPSNVLVAEYDSKPVPKIIDFGVAKATAQRLTERTLYTQSGQIVGTVEYMSPEQARFNQLDVDTRSDVYSLGVLLYELLAGSTPFERKRLTDAAFDEMLRIIREEEPPKPSTKLSSSKALPSIAANRHTEPGKLSKELHGELDWILMKALEKDRNRRYETANGLAQDIEHYLHNEPVQACPPSAAYRFRKFARRNITALAIASTGVMTLLLVIAGLVASNHLISAQRNEAEAQRQRAEENFLKARIAIRELMTEPAMGRAEWSRMRPALRKMFAERAANYYRSLIQEDTSDPSLQYETAVGYRSLAYLHEAAREFTQAEQFSRQSIAILERLNRDSPDVADYRHQLAYSLWGLAQILAQTNRLGEFEPVHRRSLAVYEQLLAEHPNVPDYPEMLIKVSHYFGETMLRQNRLEEAERAYRRSLELYAKWATRLPDDILEIQVTQFRLATTLAATRTPREAATAFDDVVQSYSDNHDTWIWAAALYLRAGDFDEYRRLCRQMFERFGNTEAPQIAERIVKTCALAPNAVDDPSALLALADRALNGTENNPYRWYFEIAKGMAEYRAGQYAVAVEWLQRVNPQAERGWPLDATAFSVLAMAQYRLGEHEQAHDASANAEQIIADYMPDINDGQFLLAPDWHDWVHAQVLHREAEELIGEIGVDRALDPAADESARTQQ